MHFRATVASDIKISSVLPLLVDLKNVYSRILIQCLCSVLCGCTSALRSGLGHKNMRRA